MQSSPFQSSLFLLQFHTFSISINSYSHPLKCILKQQFFWYYLKVPLKITHTTCITLKEKRFPLPKFFKIFGWKTEA